MRLKDVLVLFVAVACASCGGNEPPAQQQKVGEIADRQAPDPASPAPSAQPTPTAGRRDPGIVAPTADAQWTIFVQTLRGATHVGDAKRLKEQLMQSSGLKQWYIVHGNADSTLYHGYYKDISGDDPDARRADADLKKIKEMTDALTGRRVFAQAMAVTLASPDPEAPPEWNLLNSAGHYTLVIGVYSGVADRKQAAVETVRNLRAQNVSAYFHHGEGVSTVCIGAWPATAAQEGAPKQNRDPHKRVIIATGVPNERVARAMEKAQEDGDAVALSPTFTALDPTMRAMMQEYKHLHTNGQVLVREVKDRTTGQTQEVADPSYIALVPRKAENILRQDVAQNQPDPRRQQDIGAAVYGQPKDQPAATEAPRRGKLKSIGE